MSDHDGYYLYHSIGQYPGKQDQLTAALTEYSQTWSGGGDAQWPYLEDVQTDFVAKWANLLKAPTGSLAHADSVTSAVHTLVTALPNDVLSGKRVLLPEDSFPSLLFLLSGLADRYGFELELIPKTKGCNWVESDSIANRIDSEVGLVMLNWISSTSSHRCDVERLTKIAQTAGALVGIDLTQGAGILPFDVSAVPVDFAATTSLKWIAGAPGAGVLYVRPDLIQRCRPERRGWFSQDNPFNWDIDKFSLAPDARKFHLGTPSALGFVGTVSALDWVLSGGMEANRTANMSCTRKIIEVVDELGMDLASPRLETQRGASVMIALANDHVAKTTLEHLRSKEIFADTRGNILRLSPGISTSEHTVLTLHDCLAASG